MSVKWLGVLALSLVAVLGACSSTQGASNVTPVRFVGLSVVPGQTSLAAGTTLQLYASVVSSDGASQDVTAGSTWSSSKTSVVTVSPAGVVQAVGVGSAVVKAASHGLSAQVAVTVTDATLTGIEITAASNGLALGTGEQLTATGRFSDGTTQDLTAQVRWSSSDPTVASVNASSGRVSAVAQGSAEITASAASANVSASISLVVTNATLTGISVDPATATVHLGNPQAFTATGHFTDGTTQDLTRQVTWSSSAQPVASVTSAGVAKGLTAGDSSVTATLGTVSGSAALTVDAAALASISITSNAGTAPRGTTAQLTATGTYTDGSTQDLTQAVAWTSGDTNIATVSATTGVATAVNVGQVTLTASASGISGSFAFTVTAPALTGIEVSGGATTLALGTSEPLTATGLYTDGTTVDLTSSVAWSSDSANVAVTTTGTKGVATAAALGTASVTATGPGGVQGSLGLTVSDATLVSIQVTPPAASLPKGVDESFTAIGIFSDGSNQDLTASATWSSSDTSVATVLQGTATTVGVGTTTVRASFDGISGSVPFNVTAAELVSLSVTPSSLNLASGQTQQLTLTALLTDGTTVDVTSAATWTTDGVAIASVTDGGSSHGFVQATGPGIATVTGAYGGKSKPITVTVSSAVLVGISVSGTTSVPSGLTSQLTATGLYSDGTTGNLTNAVVWSSDSSAVSVSNTSGTQGLATAGTPGAATVTATQSGISGTLQVTATDATLVSMTVNPSVATLAKGTSLQIVVTGSYSDGSSLDITSAMTFTSANSSAVSVSNAAGSHGRVTALLVGGPVTITASDTAGHSASIAITVSDATLVSIAVSPSSATLVGTQTQTYTATGTYTDGSTQNLTSQVTWTSGSPSVADVSNAAGSQGQAQGVAPGTTQISASLNGVSSNTASLEVIARALATLAVTPNPLVLPSGTGQLTATGTYNDGSTADLTSQVAWVSDNVADYTVASNGTVSWVANGSAHIYAVLGSVSGSVVAEQCPAGFYVVGNKCAYDYYVDDLGLVDQPDACGTGNPDAYYNDTYYNQDYGMQWTDIAPASMTPSSIKASFSVGVACYAATQTYHLAGGAAAGPISVQADCTCPPFEQQQMVDLTVDVGSYVVGGQNEVLIDSPSYTQNSNSYDFGLMPDSAINGHYGKVTVVY